VRYQLRGAATLTPAHQPRERLVAGKLACEHTQPSYATSMNRDWERNSEPSTRPSEGLKRLSIACLRSKQVSAGHLTSRRRQGSVQRVQEATRACTRHMLNDSAPAGIRSSNAMPCALRRYRPRQPYRRAEIEEKGAQCAIWVLVIGEATHYRRYDCDGRENISRPPLWRREKTRRRCLARLV
jgi:hypothetical protein